MSNELIVAIVTAVLVYFANKFLAKQEFERGEKSREIDDTGKIVEMYRDAMEEQRLANDKLEKRIISLTEAFDECSKQLKNSMKK